MKDFKIGDSFEGTDRLIKVIDIHDNLISYISKSQSNRFSKIADIAKKSDFIDLLEFNRIPKEEYS